MNRFPPHLLQRIAGYSHQKEVIRLTSCCKHFLDVITVISIESDEITDVQLKRHTLLTNLNVLLNINITSDGVLQCHWLTYLHVAHTKVIPGKLSVITSLVSLDISYLIDIFEMEAISLLTNLTCLYARHTNIMDEDIQPLTNLIDLDISDTVISDEGVLPLVKLESIGMCNTKSLSKSLTQLPKLTSIYGRNSEISDLHIRDLTLTLLSVTTMVTDASIVGKTKLIHLNLSSNLITTASVSTLINLEQLSIWSLQGDMELLTTLKNLEELSCNRSIPVCIGELTKLTRLDVKRCPYQACKCLPSLETLKCQNIFTKDEIVTLTSLWCLKMGQINSTARDVFDDETIESIRKLPYLQILNDLWIGKDRNIILF
jgi:hypothetical protein